ncbi:hypothetical protein CGC21_27545 [Leishmania donovani]|uniref:Uncharacterized protein n=1 Tax=Leishmania donovani TaxID=5661 RepID=A0A504Y6I1_LEIDO|nr:hypothetical protein CGC21_27545 [Leishmania donovani]
MPRPPFDPNTGAPDAPRRRHKPSPASAGIGWRRKFLGTALLAHVPHAQRFPAPQRVRPLAGYERVSPGEEALASHRRRLRRFAKLLYSLRKGGAARAATNSRGAAALHNNAATALGMVGCGWGSAGCKEGLVNKGTERWGVAAVASALSLLAALGGGRAGAWGGALRHIWARMLAPPARRVRLSFRSVFVHCAPERGGEACKFAKSTLPEAPAPDARPTSRETVLRDATFHDKSFFTAAFRSGICPHSGFAGRRVAGSGAVWGGARASLGGSGHTRFHAVILHTVA